jgi:hypothetical protein
MTIRRRRKIFFPFLSPLDNFQGLHDPVLRDELYLHVMKQLTENPDPKSVEKGWKHLALMLHTFPPTGLDNFLDKWIIENAGPRTERLLAAFYATLYTERRQMELSETETRRVLEGKNLKNFKAIQNDKEQSPHYAGYTVPKYRPPKFQSVFPNANKVCMSTPPGSRPNFVLQ